MSSPTATATGTLASRPLGELLIFGLEQELAGSLVVESPEGIRSALMFRAGRVVKLRLGDAQFPFGALAKELGLVSESDLAVLNTPGDGLVGQRLIGTGALDEQGLSQVLVLQAQRRMGVLAALPPDSAYGYYEGADLLARSPLLDHKVDSLNLIGVAMAAGSAMKALQFVAQLGDRKLKLHPASRVGRFDFPQATKTVLDVLRAKPHSYPELLRTQLAEEAAIAAAVFTLALARHLDLGGGEPPLDVDVSVSVLAPPRTTAERRRIRTSVHSPRRGGRTSPTGVPAARSTAPKEPPPDEKALRKELEELSIRSETVDYYELLGVAENAKTADIQAAFFQLAKKWHPDRAAQPLKELRDEVTRVFSRLTEAHQVLTTPAQRAEYDRLRSDGGDSEEDQARVHEILRAATFFQKAEILAKKADWRGAEKLVDRAIADDPETPAYGALRAWVIAKSGRCKDEDYPELIAALSRAHAAQPKNIRVRDYRAQVLKLAGKIPEAMREFRAVIEEEPDNVDAQRELRLYKMRRTDGEDSSRKDAGLFGGLFRKR